VQRRVDGELRAADPRRESTARSPPPPPREDAGDRFVRRRQRQELLFRSRRISVAARNSSIAAPSGATFFETTRGGGSGASRRRGPSPRRAAAAVERGPRAATRARRAVAHRVTWLPPRSRLPRASGRSSRPTRGRGPRPAPSAGRSRGFPSPRSGSPRAAGGLLEIGRRRREPDGTTSRPRSRGRKREPKASCHPNLPRRRAKRPFSPVTSRSVAGTPRGGARGDPTPGLSSMASEASTRDRARRHHRRHGPKGRGPAERPSTGRRSAPARPAPRAPRGVRRSGSSPRGPGRLRIRQEPPETLGEVDGPVGAPHVHGAEA